MAKELGTVRNDFTLHFRVLCTVDILIVLIVASGQVRFVSQWVSLVFIVVR